jgi:6-phosphogluconolactonase
MPGMLNLSSTQKRKRLGVSSVVISIISLGAMIAILGSFSIVSGAFSSSPAGTGAVYIIDNSATGNNVWVYSRAPNGHLSSSGTPFSTGGKGTGSNPASQGAVVLTQDGRWLLVVDAGSNQITVFRVVGTILVRTSITSSHGSDPISLAVSGNLVYVLDAGGSGNIAGFTLNNGVLHFIPGSVRPLSGQASPSPEQIGFNPRGNVIVVAEKATNTIDTYEVGSNGVASSPDSQVSAGSGPYGFAFTSQGYLIVSEAASNSVSSYAVSASGQLRTISGAIPTFGLAPCWLVIGGNNQFAYTTNAHGGTISTFSISRSGGLTLFSSVAAHTAVPSLDMSFSQNSHFLYVRNGGAITGFQVFPDGSISQITMVSGIPSSATGLAAF